MPDRTPDWTPEQTAELTPLARVIDRAIRNAPVLFAEGPAALVPHVTVAVAAYMGGIVGPVPATPESPTTDTTARDELYQAARRDLAASAAVIEQVRGIVRRLAAHAVGFQDVLDDSDRAPWAKTVGADITALCTTLDGPSQPVTPGEAEPYRFVDADGDYLHIGVPGSPANGGSAVSFYTEAEPVHVPVEQIEELIAAVRRLAVSTAGDGR
jgi:hypothetical protein